MCWVGAQQDLEGRLQEEAPGRSHHHWTQKSWSCDQMHAHAQHPSLPALFQKCRLWW